MQSLISKLLPLFVNSKLVHSRLIDYLAIYALIRVMKAIYRHDEIFLLFQDQ